MKHNKQQPLFILLALYITMMSPTTQAEDATALREIPTLQLSIYQTNSSINSPMDGELILTNLTNKTYDIQSVKIFLPQSILSIRPDFNEIITNELHAVGGKDERIYTFGIPRVTMPLATALLDSETLLFVPGTYRLRAEVVLKQSGNDKGKRSLYAITEINLEPPLNSVLRGGVIGALLLSLFVPAYRNLYKRKNRTLKTTETLKDSFYQFIIYLISGSVVSITAILLIHRIGSANLPISITVNDYLGGIIVGLFSYVIGNALYNQFFNVDNTE